MKATVRANVLEDEQEKSRGAVWEISRNQFVKHFAYSCHTDMNELYP